MRLRIFENEIITQSEICHVYAEDVGIRKSYMESRIILVKDVGIWQPEPIGRYHCVLEPVKARRRPVKTLVMPLLRHRHL